MDKNKSSLTHERLQLAKEATDLGIWEWNADEDKLFWDERTIELFGPQPEEGVEEFFERVHPEDRDAVRTAVNETAESGKSFHQRYRVKRDGDPYWVEAHGKWIERANSTHDRLIGSVKDITEEMSRQKELEIFKLTMDQIPDEIYVVDPETSQILDVTDEVGRTLGYSKDELRSMRIQNINPDAGEQLEWEKLAERIIQNGPITFETVNQPKNGDTYPVEIHADYTEINGEGRIIATCRDITDRKEFEASLRKSEKLYRTLFEDTREGFLIKSLDGRILDANNTAEEMLGYSSEELTGMNLADITTAEVKERCGEQGIVECQLEQFKDSIYNWSYLKKDGSVVPVEKHLTPIEYHGEKAVLASLRDRSEIEHLRKKDQRKSSFVSQVTHDLRTPLNAITGMGELLKDTDLTEEQKDYLQTVLNASRNMERLTNEIVDLNRIEQGELILKEEPFNLHRLLGELISLFGQEIEESEVILSTEVADGVPDRLVGDPDRLKQILMNLVENAINHTEKGEIKVQSELLEQKEDTVVLSFSVSDTGAGIPEDELQNIFLAHKQVKSDRSKSGKGLGIGLSICKNLVEEMNGEINVQSEIGQGTTFRFTVELQADQEDTSNFSLSDVNVLLVEDNSLIRKVFLEYLDSHNINASECETGEEALQELLDEGMEYDVVFMDHRLDDMTGVDVLKKVAESNEGVDSERIYLVSGDPSEKIEGLIGSTPCAGVLEKPVEESTLINAVSSVVLTRSQQSDEEEVNELKEKIRNQHPQPLHILVADDDQDNRTLMKELLSPVTDKLTFVKNGQEAVDRRFEDPPNLILMDLEMPEMTGLEAMEVIRRKEEKEDLPSVPIITQTAKAMKHVETTCLKAGADRFVCKPIKKDRLYRSILDVLSGLDE